VELWAQRSSVVLLAGGKEKNMGLLGQGWDDPQTSANMALAAGLLQGNLGAGFAGASQAYGNAKDTALKRQLVQSQMDNYASEVEARKLKTIQDQRQQSMIEGLFPGLMGGSPAGGPAMAGPPQMSPPAMPGAAPGAPTQSAMGGPPGPGAMPPAAQQGMLALVQHLGIPPEAIQADILFNGGKKISEMIAERSKPNWQNVNGNLVNTSVPGFQGGLQAGMNASSDGRVTAWQPDGRGGLVVGAPAGAFDTYGKYQDIGERSKANYDPVTVTPQGQNPQMTTRGALVRNPAVSGQVSPEQQAMMDRDRTTILQQEVTKAQAQLNEALSRGDQSAAARAQADLAALSREMGGRRPTVGLPLQSEEEKLRTTEGVRSDAKRNETLSGDAQKSKDTLANITEARRLLQLGPTSSGVGSVVDAGASLFGASTKSADLASKLDTLSGWMVSNVPRMEGPQSNFDVQNYKTMAGLIGDRTKPLSQRMSALDTLEKLQQKYASLNGGSNTVNVGNTGGATGDFSPKSVINELPKTAPKGQRVRDTQTGKVLQFNGLSWIEVK
jgi:hypothetical protein